MIPDRIKEMTKVILESLIRDGRVGIENGAQDRRINFVRQQFDYLESALELLIDLEDNEEDFNFEDFGDQMCEVLHCRCHNVEDVESVITTWLDYADCTINDELGFTEDEINQLAKIIADESNLS